MHLQIITPEHVVFDSEVDSVTLPGKDGEFQLLNNHAPIVATLGEGTVKIKVHTQTLKILIINLAKFINLHLTSLHYY